jgi:hypothetical protein
MMKPFAESDFLVVFTGESPASRVIRTWDRVLAFLDYESTNGEPDESWRDPENSIHDVHAWIHLEPGDDDAESRFTYSADIGETDHVEIIRITEPINEEWLDDVTHPR